MIENPIHEAEDGDPRVHDRGAASERTKDEAPTYVYALGRIDPRFRSLGLQKEFLQATRKTDVAKLTDREALQRVLSDRANRYLARQICWVFTIEGLDTYMLAPRDPMDLDVLIEALRPTPHPGDVDVVIGLLGPIASPDMCNGLVVPIVAFDQIYSFDRDSYIKAIPMGAKAGKSEQERFRAVASELFDHVMQLADNAGARDEHRALNYLAVRDPVIYARAAEAYIGNSSLTGVEVRPSRLSGTRKVVDVIFSFTHRDTDVLDRFFARVDVTEEFPFVVTKLSPYYER